MRYKRPNPPKTATKIYDKCLLIQAIKGKNSLWPEDLFEHKFDEDSNAEIFGLKDGSILIIGKKALWKQFPYDADNLERYE